MKQILSVQTTIQTRNKGFVWFPAEFTLPDSVQTTDAAVEAVTAMLRGDDIVLCDRLDYPPAPAPTDARPITGRKRIALGRGVIGIITAMHFDLYEADDAQD